jgi:hypothetical protein
LVKDEHALLAEYVSSTPTLHKLLFPPTKYEHTRGVLISTRLEYDDGIQLWTRIGADLGLAKSFAHRKGERKLKSIVLIGKATPKDNTTRAEDVSKFFGSMALASPGTLLCLDELKTIHVNLREVGDAISIESLKRFLTWIGTRSFKHSQNARLHHY